MAGTEFIPLRGAASNSSFTVFEVKFAPLPTEDEMTSIIDGLVERFGDILQVQLKDWRIWIEFRATLRKIAGHPRVCGVSDSLGCLLNHC